MKRGKSDRKFTVLAVDDEETALQSVVRKVDHRTDLRVVYATTDGEKALLYAKDHPVDIAIIDLDLRTMEGYQIIDILDSDTQVIVSTGLENSGSQAMDRGAIDFINKPCTQERFDRAVDRAIDKKMLLESWIIPGIADTVQLPEADTELTYSIRWEDIVYFRAREKLSVVFLRDGRALKCKKMLRNIEERLPTEFLRIAKSFILNLREVDRYDLRNGSRKVMLRSVHKDLWNDNKDIELLGEIDNELPIGDHWVDRFAEKMGGLA